MINNRQQAGRRRGRGGNGNGNGNGNGGTGGAPRQGGQGRSDNGNRIDSRARGNANQLYEKYKNLASDAQRQGDRVNTEYYLQFADHYFRVLSDQRGRFEEQPPRRQQPDFDIDGNDDDYADEGEPIRIGEQQGGQQEVQTYGRADRQDRDRQDRDRHDRPQRDAQDRNERPMQDRGDSQERVQERAPDRDRQPQDRGEQRQDRPREARRPDGERTERPRRWDRDDRPRQQEGETEVAGQHRADPIGSGEDLEARADAVIAADAPLQVEPAPRRRGRPRRETPPADQPAAEAQLSPAMADDAHGNSVDADRLPPSLGASLGAPANDADDDAPKPRRRRVRTAGTGEASVS